MKKSLVFLFAVFAVFCIQAQSKKVINQQMNSELALLQKEADSIKLVHSNKQREINHLRLDVRVAKEKFEVLKNEEAIIRQRISSKHGDLKELGFDANTLVSYDEVKALVSPASGKNYSTEPSWYNQKVMLLNTPGVQDLTELKVKAQNEILKAEIEAFKDVNTRNRALLQEDVRIIDSCKAAINDLNTIRDSYMVFNQNLNDKYMLLRNKYKELIDKQQEEARLKREKEVLAAAKSKSKNPKTIPFVPPVIMDDEPYEDRTPYSKDTRGNGNIHDEFVPAPPMEVLPSPPPTAPVVYDVVEEPAEFPGGKDALNKFITDYIKIPETAIEKGLSGKVYLKFVVSEKGNISNVKVVRGITDCPECDAEAVRVIKKMPNWNPAKNDGKAVNSWYTLPVQFKVQ